MTSYFFVEFFQELLYYLEERGCNMSNTNQTNTPKTTATPTPREIRSGERPTYSAPLPPKK